VARAAFQKPDSAEVDVASTSGSHAPSSAAPALAASVALLVLTGAGPAAALDAGASPFEGVTANSLYVTLALFLMSVPGEQGGLRGLEQYGGSVALWPVGGAAQHQAAARGWVQPVLFCEPAMPRMHMTHDLV
jgi:hypothetical protein